jgi:2-keto-4-pentenoate hydratase/2-oxohepta-3-ene-1,7-dioic acid hydratase in catechol pathway
VRLVTYDTRAGPAERVGVLRDDAAVPAARLRAPLRPRTLRDFLTFPEHTERSRAALGLGPIPQLWYEVPAYYKGLPDTVIGPEDEIPWPSYSDQLDQELEIACVIGRSGRDIARDDWREHVFGWTIWNDMSARDTQGRELPLGMGPGKAKDWDGTARSAPARARRRCTTASAISSPMPRRAAPCAPARSSARARRRAAPASSRGSTLLRAI